MEEVKNENCKDYIINSYNAICITRIIKVISFDIANPIMFLALATLLVLRSIEYKKSRENSSFILTVITAVFLYVVVIIMSL